MVDDPIKTPDVVPLMTEGPLDIPDEVQAQIHGLNDIVQR